MFLPCLGFFIDFSLLLGSNFAIPTPDFVFPFLVFPKNLILGLDFGVFKTRKLRDSDH